MNSRNFLSVFGDYIDNDVLKGQLKNVEIESMTLFREKRNLAVILEIAAMNQRLKKMGYNTAEEFNKKLEEQYLNGNI